MMKRILTLALILLMCAGFAVAEGTGVDPFKPVGTADMAETADGYAVLNVNFGDGAEIIRFKGSADERTIVRMYLDEPEGTPAATAVFLPITVDCRIRCSVRGIHNVYFRIEGTGTFTGWQAFTSDAEVEAAVRAESGVRYDDVVPSRYFVPCEQGGSVERFTYTAHDYMNEKEAYEKAALVYLPHGYDPQAACDLLILCHGIGGNEYEWGLNEDRSRLKAILDNLIREGEIRPVIVVTPNGRAGRTEDYSSFYAFDQELRYDLLPALAANYAVDVHDRSRCFMAGLSMGGMQTINLGIGKCLDLFSAFGAFSAAPTSNPASVTAAVLNAAEDLPVRLFYSVCGTEDDIAYASASAAVNGLDRLTDRLNGNNLVVQYRKGGHDFSIWHLGVYNFLKLLQ